MQNIDLFCLSILRPSVFCHLPAFLFWLKIWRWPEGGFLSFFICYLRAPKANFGPLQEGRLTHPMLITRIWIKIREEYSELP